MIGGNEVKDSLNSQGNHTPHSNPSRSSSRQNKYFLFACNPVVRWDNSHRGVDIYCESDLEDNVWSSEKYGRVCLEWYKIIAKFGSAWNSNTSGGARLIVNCVIKSQITEASVLFFACIHTCRAGKHTSPGRAGNREAPAAANIGKRA
jgi:hypothetical protein